MKSKRIGCLVLSLVWAMGLVGCAPFSSPQTVTFFDVFDTVSTVTVYSRTADFTAESEQLHAFLTEYHQLYDIYETYDGVVNLKTVNDAAGQEPVAVDGKILDLLEWGVEASRITDGRVNILYGAVLKQWHDCRTEATDAPSSAHLPEATALQEAIGHVDLSCLVIDRTAGTVNITDKAARLDVGAIAKGYVTELAAVYARDTLGWTSAVLDIGGNVRVIGDKNGSPFRVGITNPDETAATSYIDVAKVRDKAVVTSGDYQRYFTVDGKRYAHIIDVDTGYPAELFRSVTVVGPDSGVADLLSTALFTVSEERGKALLDSFEGYEALWIATDGSRQESAGWKEGVSS